MTPYMENLMAEINFDEKHLINQQNKILFTRIRFK